MLELRPSQALSSIFIAVVLVGTLLLKLPFAAVDGISFIDALFTATSATCVTGLMVVDVGTKFTPFGQLIILLLIQVGGLGIMTFSTLFMVLLGRSLSMKDTSIVFDSLDRGRKLSIRQLLKHVMLLTFSIEAVGAIFLFFRWVNEMGIGKAAYYATFHSISGFCNAGITLFPDSLISYSDDLMINGVVGLLIFFGSLGFITIVELNLFINEPKSKRGKRRLTLNSKITLFVSVLLLIFSAVMVFTMERNNALAGMPLWDQGLASIFQSVTKTAGFVTVDFSEFTNGSLYLFMLLMFIGAAPGSVGGGIKVTTFGVIVALVISRIKARESVSIFQRTVPEQIVSRSLAILFVSILIIVIFTTILLFTESGSASSPEHRDMFMKIMFEVVSAFGTVGLSAGATETLSEFGKVMVTLLMLIGRLGPLTVAMAVGTEYAKGSFQYSEENVVVG